MEPEDDRYAGPVPQPVLTVAAVARRLGVAPSTLRTWDRRYDLGPSTHTAGSHRRYSAGDLARLVVMRGLVQQGVPPAEAAQIALSASAEDPLSVLSGTDRAPVPGPPGPDPGETVAEPSWGDPNLQAGITAAGPRPAGPRPSWALPAAIPAARGQLWGDDGPLSERPLDLLAGHGLADPGEAADPDPDAAPPAVGPGVRRLHAASASMFTSLPGSVPAQPPVLPAGRRSAAGRAGGGRVVALPDGSPQARGLARAAMSLDTREVARMLRDAVAAFGVVAAWEGLAMPVLQAIGDRWQSTGEGVDVEHAFTESLLTVLRGVTGTLERPRNTCPVLLSCAELEQHSIPLHVLAAALAEVGVGCRMLGENMPPEALIAAVRRTGPGVVFLYARLPVIDAEVVEQLPRQRPAPRVVLGGPGWDAVGLPGAVLRVDTLGSAVGEVVSGVHL